MVSPQLRFSLLLLFLAGFHGYGYCNSAQESLERTAPVYQFVNKAEAAAVLEAESSREETENFAIGSVSGRIHMVPSQFPDKCIQYFSKYQTPSDARSTCERAPPDTYVVFIETFGSGSAEAKASMKLRENTTEVVKNSTVLQGGGMTMPGGEALWMAPQPISGSDKTEKSPLKKWMENIQQNPQREPEKFATNYIGRPILGSYYYVAAKSSGLTNIESFGYSVFVSTFLWQYGIESAAGGPTRQEIWATPLLGSLIGHGFHLLKERIMEQGGSLLGSEWLGNVTLLAIDPISSIKQGIEEFVGNKTIRSVDLQLTRRPSIEPGTNFVIPGNSNPTRFGVELVIRF